MTWRFVHNQDVGLPSSWIIPGSSAGHNWHVREGFDRFITGTNINVSGCECKDDAIVAKATSVCIGISFVG